MSKNSIRANITKSDIISTIRMSISADIKHETTYIIVEGFDDIAFFRKNLAPNATILESFSGKQGVRDIVELFDIDSVIGVCDRDYDTSYNNERIFHYDYSCLEMMLISNDDSFLSIVGEYYQSACNPMELRENLLKELLWLSCLRKLNYDYSLGIRFDGFSLHNSIDKNKFSIPKALQELLKINPNFIECHRNNIKKAEVLSAQFSLLEELFSITQGHDFICYFHAICILAKGASKHCSVESISSSLRCGYRLDDLKKTSFFHELNQYETKVEKSFLS